MKGHLRHPDILTAKLHVRREHDGAVGQADNLIGF
jgi:hypothetical protein